MLSALGSNSLAKACQTYHFNQNGQFAGIYDFKLTNYGELNQYWLANAKDHLLIMCHPALAQSNDQDPNSTRPNSRISILQFGSVPT